MDEPTDHHRPPPVPRPDDTRISLPPQRHGCLTAFMVIFGIILLLPGLCALLFTAGTIYTFQFDQLVSGGPIIIVGLIVAALGVLLIRAATRDPRR